MGNNETQPLDICVVAAAAAAKGQDEAAQEPLPTESLSPLTQATASPQTYNGTDHPELLAVRDALKSKDAADSSTEAHEPSVEHKSLAVAAAPASTQNYVPPAKKYSAVNINKAFLKQHQASASGVPTGSSAASSSKQTSAIAKPTPQAASTHSRLVTTKLTATPSSSSPGPGWSRPNSVTPPVPSPSSGGNLAKSSTPASVSVGAHVFPQVAPGGKIIHPQARSAAKPKTDGTGKPAWRSVQSSAMTPETKLPGDFPTAAEAAQGRLPKPTETKSAPDATEAQRQALSETADAFRGVHLDPNAHHWDDMEEDDNDFLGGVIEFGDGRQYTIQQNIPTAQAGSESPVRKEERFADDFDRTWPRTRTELGTETQPSHEDEQTDNIPSFAADASSGMSGVTRDNSQSRVLYNERLNRMEPLPEGRSGSGAMHAPRMNLSFRRSRDAEGPGTYPGSRLERDTHSHISSAQVLHKGERTCSHRSDLHAIGDRRREYDGVDSHSTLSTDSRYEHGRRRQDYAPSLASRESSISRDTMSQAHDDHHRQPHTGRAGPWGRPSASGQKDMQGQVPPQMTMAQSTFQDSTSGEAAARSEQSREHSSDQLTAVQNGKHGHDSSEAPSFEDEEALRKAYLAQKAEQAKKRRQQEEEEREKAAERARQKADEIARQQAEKVAQAEGRKASEAKSSADTHVAPPAHSGLVNNNEGLQNEAKSMTEDVTRAAAPVLDSSASKSPPTGSSVLKDINLLTAPSGDLKALPEPTPRLIESEQVESRTKPDYPLTSTISQSALNETTSMIPSVHVFDLHADDATEVIDFTDIGRLAGGKISITNVASVHPAPKVSRPFGTSFNDTVSSKAESDSWRRPSISTDKERAATIKEDGQELHRQGAPPERPSEAPGVRLLSQALATSNSANVCGVYASQKLSSSAGDSGSALHASGHTHNHSTYSRFPRSPGAPYREVPLSALDDTMSRIKGALDGMHLTSVLPAGKSDANALHLQATATVSEVESNSVSSPRPDRWLPPALRTQSIEQRRPEVFECTQMELLYSLSPTDSKVIVRLPKTSRRIEPLSAKQLKYSKLPTLVRWDILSFDPPVEGMTRKSLSVNDVLFRKPPGSFRMKFRVALPTSSHPIAHGNGPIAPRIHVPTVSGTKGDGFGASGRSKMMDQDNWRTTASAVVETPSTSLAVTSRSPPPDLSTVPQPDRSSATLTPMHGRIATVSKVKSHKMPEGEDVAFYRDSRKTQDGLNNVPIVTFTVSSELDDQRQSPDALHATEIPLAMDASPISNLQVDDAPITDSSMQIASENPHDTPSTVEITLASATNQPDSMADAEIPLNDKEGTSYVDQQNTLSQQTPIWAKATARVPDPEHLKAVWSQASDKQGLPTVNSLKSIADDLTAVPFILHEVKSEDGGTPPPQSGAVAPPTRMSASEVTRAFQTVPSAPSSSLSSSTLRSGQMQNGIGSPASPHRHIKPSSMGLPAAPPMSPPGPRTQYLSYPSASSHSPSPPTLVYSHVMPNGMPNSQTALSHYGQPVWAPIGPQVVRPQPPSPYSPSMLPYHVPGNQNGMYAPSSNISNSHGSPSSYTSAPSSQMVVSPALPHATPIPPQIMYSPGPGPVIISPVPPPGSAQPRPYCGITSVNRGTAPTVQSSMDSRQHTSSIHTPSTNHRFPGHGSGYPHVPPQPFVRPW